MVKLVSMRLAHDVDISGKEWTDDFVVAATYETENGRFAVKAHLSSEMINDPYFSIIPWLNKIAQDQFDNWMANGLSLQPPEHV